MATKRPTQQDIDSYQNQIRFLEKYIENLKEQLKETNSLKIKLSGYKKVIQFLVGIENGDVLTSEVK